MRIIATLFMLIVSLLLSTPAFCLDYYVNGATGTDSATCGQQPATSCRTIKKALDNIPDGQVTIKIARGTYIEDHLGVWATSSIKNDVTFEGGWSSDFTSHLCGVSGTTIIPGYTSNQGWPVLFHLSVSGNNNQAAMTVKCMMLEKTASGDITSALYVDAEQQGQANLTMKHVRVTGFSDPNMIRFHSRPDGNISALINNSIFNGNQGKNILKLESDNGHISLALQKSKLNNNGDLDKYDHTLFLKVNNQGSITANLENNIIAGNFSRDRGTGIVLLAFDNLSVISFNSTNDTITDNTSMNHGGALHAAAGDQGEVQITMINSILKGNHATSSAPDLSLGQGMYNDNNGTVFFSATHCILGEYSIFEGTPTYSSTNEVDEDPGLNSTYHITSGSPARDAGICGYTTGGGPIWEYHRVAPYEDIDGDRRPGWGKLMGCDIGADEYRFPWILYIPPVTGMGRR